MSVRDRMAARWRAQELDGLLALGVPVRGRPVLAARAAQVSSPQARRALASALEAAVAEAGNGGGSLSAAAPLARDAVGREAAALLALAGELREPEVSPHGVALARRLVSGYGSPLTDPEARVELGFSVARVRAALAGAEAPRALPGEPESRRVGSAQWTTRPPSVPGPSLARCAGSSVPARSWRSSPGPS